MYSFNALAYLLTFSMPSQLRKLFNLILTTFIIVTASSDSDSREEHSSENQEYNEVFNLSLKEKPKRTRQEQHQCFNAETSSEITNKPQCGYQDHISTEKRVKDESTLSRYPFSASIQRKGAHYATGALLNNRWILSSAGEFYNVRESIKLFKVRLGSSDCKRGGVLIPIRGLVIHPSYIFGKPSFDLAMLKIAVPVNYSPAIRPVRLSKVTAKLLDANFLTTYWPRIIIKGRTISPSASERTRPSSMRVSTQSTVPREDCEEVMEEQNETLGGDSFCLKPVGGHHSACSPDVGAPVIANDGLWGITSGWTSRDCERNESPTIITRTSSSGMRAWLDEQLLDT
ncbi:trypsin-like [Bombyx mandarina]|uniref:Trypsin-like n=1 Tax=Bombyx mandarina TaxID=7092 RepID=A0A6J2KH11_BOMMA|nr:trypsin-like [Bombyx mandarina]